MFLVVIKGADQHSTINLFLVTVPQKEPYDPMSFPPGLIPTLVREKNLTDPPYSPLSPLDIEQAGLPPAQAPDAYLTSRIEKFNAELKVT